MTSAESSPSTFMSDSYFNFPDSSQKNSVSPDTVQLLLPSSTNFQLFKQKLINARTKHRIPELKITNSEQLDSSPPIFTQSSPNINSIHHSNKFFNASTLNITTIKTIGEYEKLIFPSPSEDVVVVDLRPFNQYNISRVHDSLSICIPSTLLKRNSFNLTNIFKTMIASQELTLETKLQNSNDLKIIFYDGNSIIDHCSLQLYQIIKKFQEKINDYNKPIQLFIVNEGFQLFTKYNNGIENKYIDFSKFKIVKSPDQACFSDFLLPSADPTSSFLMSLKSNQLSVNHIDTFNHDAAIHLPYFKDVNNLPNWLKKYSTPDCIESIVSKFNKIENSENQRLSASVSIQRRNSSNNNLNKLSDSSNSCSPVSPNAGTYNLIGPENGFKNRYPNILPYEHSRVRLITSPLPSANNTPSNPSGNFYFPNNLPVPPPIQHQTNLSLLVTTPTSSSVQSDSSPSPLNSAITNNTSRKPSLTPIMDDYFNANFINAPQINDQSHYIATQAPLPSTIDDFWKVVWHNKSEIIISLTNLSEYGMKKSDIYWNDSSSIKLIEEIENFNGLKGLIVRKIELTKRSKKKIVHQLHYMNWPDHGTANPSNILKLIDIKDQFIQDKSSPIVVHCSAGCGRTGTFICIDLLLQSFKQFDEGKKSSINVWETEDDLINLTVQQIRKQRILMVQSLQQFILCYETIIYYFYNEKDSKESNEKDFKESK